MNFLNRLKYARDLYLSTIFVVGTIIIIAFLSTQHFVRYDLTEGQQYAIADVSKNVMQGLDDIVTVQVYFSQKLPPNLLTTRLYVEDVLDELSSYANGNLQVRFLNPDQEEVAQEALQLGIPMIRMNILEKDKYEVKNGFLGIAISYAGDFEIIPVVQDTVNLEYDFVASIKKLVAKEQRTVGFLTGHEEYSITSLSSGNSFSQYGTVLAALKRNYDVVEVSLDEEDALASVDTLIVAGPKEAFVKWEKQALDHYIITGGNVIFLIEPIHVNDAFEASPIETNLEDLIAHYGVDIQSHFVLDDSNETASFAQGYINFVVDYPFWVKTLKENFNAENPIMSKVDSVVLPWASPLELKGGKVEALAKTTEEAWVQTAPFDLDPNIEATEDTERNQEVVAALIEGPFKSYYQKRPKLPGKKKKEGRLVVIGNARFMSDRALNQFKQNLGFFLNAVDYLTLDESLIGIRSKSANDRPLMELSDNERQVVKWAGTFLVPILIVLYGIVRATLRRRKKNLIR